METDINKLADFLCSIRTDIDFVVKNLNDLSPEMELNAPNKELYPQIIKVWQLIFPYFDRIKDYLQKEQPITQLESRGLTGAQLELKLTIYNLRKKEFETTKNEYIQNKNKSSERNKWSILRNILSKLLRVIDRVLESMVFIPQIDAVKEFKSAMEELIS